MQFSAKLFDGQTSQAHEVTIVVQPDRSLLIVSERGDREVIHQDGYTYQAPVGRSAIRIRMRGDNRLLEVQFSEDIVNAFSGHLAPSLRFVLDAESKPLLAVGIVVGSVIFSVLLYLYGLPIAVRVVQPFVPHSVKIVAGNQILNALDTIMLNPSSLTGDKQREIESVTHSLTAHAALPDELHVVVRRFGKGKKEDIPNAFAILPRTILVTDALVEDLTPDELEGVLAHEIGHLYYDHGTRILLRSSLISVLTLALFGGDPGTIQALALGLLEANYSQDQEREADSYAVSFLKQAGKDPVSLARALKKITGMHTELAFEKYLSTHPSTSERIAYIEAASGL